MRLRLKPSLIISELSEAINKANEYQVRKLLIKLQEKCAGALYDECGFSLLCNSLENRHTRGIAKLLLRFGAQVNSNSIRLTETPLHLAIKHKDLEIIWFLLGLGANVEARNSVGHTPLYCAVESNQEDIVVLLINAGVKIDNTNINNFNPFVAAAKNGNDKIFNLLTNQIEKLNAGKPYDGPSMLRIAVERGYSDTVEKIVKKNINSNINSHPDNIKLLTIAVMGDRYDYVKIVKILVDAKFTNDPENAKNSVFLHNALKKNFSCIVEDLLEYDIDPNVTDSDGNTLFAVACKYGHPDLVAALIEKADILLKNNFGRNDILFNIFESIYSIMDQIHYNFKWNNNENSENYVVLHNKWVEIIKILINRGIDVNEKNNLGLSPLHFIAKSQISITLCSFRPIAKLLIDAGASVDDTDKSGITPLEYSILQERPELVEEFLLNGKSVDFKDPKSQCLLYHAARNKSSSIVEMLLKRNLNVNATNKDGCTPLHLAAKFGSDTVVKCLLKHNAEVDAKDRKEMTALHYAADNCDSTSTIKELLKYNADPNSTDINGLTPLLIVAKRNFTWKLEFMKLLLKSGADINVIDKSQGKTALHIVAYYQEDLISLLLNYGADINIRCKKNQTALDCVIEAMTSYCKQCGHTLAPQFRTRDVLSISREYRKNAHTLIEHMIKLKNIDIYVCEENLQSFKKYMDLIGWAYSAPKTPEIVKKTSIAEFQKRCDKEAQLLKQTYIHDTSLTFYKILRKSTHRLARIMSDSIIQKLQTSKYMVKFHIYHDFIRNRIDKGLERRNILDQDTENSVQNFICKLLPYNCIDEIMSYLNNDDLQALISASRVSTTSDTNKFESSTEEIREIIQILKNRRSGTL
ncbi:ankyrin-3 [Microplitis demolitor]|uniref:ankyrin-3 n=1 Tax=Microplitis demolitor TaxID=69319 RepID=UPI0004CD403B|nr:ankyrin-3 [Microplitis demolitor]XP_053598708.1 ankyrin-3 [Microplitis demolitor]